MSTQAERKVQKTRNKPLDMVDINENTFSSSEIQNTSFQESLKISQADEEKDNSLKMKNDDDKYKEQFLSMVRVVFDDAELPEKFAEWSYEEQHEWVTEKGRKELPALLGTLGSAISSLIRPGDCGRAATEKPDWLDMKKFRRGQKFALDHMFGLCFSNILSLYLLFVSDHGLKPLIFTRKSHTPYLAFKRYLSTVQRVRHWYVEDPWTKGTSAYNDIQTVRRMHLSIAKQMIERTREEFDEATQISNPWCPMRNVFLEDFRSSCTAGKSYVRLRNKLEKSSAKPQGINQSDMAATQFAFMGLIILYPKAFGAHHATDEDLEAFCHVWKGIGYLLGIEDEYNFCRGNLKEITQRSRDFIEHFVKPSLADITPEWEHMTRCLVEGNRYYIGGASYMLGLLYLTELLQIPMPYLYSKLNFTTRLLHMINKFFFYYILQIPQVLSYLNKAVNKAIDKALNYSPEKHSELEERSAKTLLDFSIT